MKVIQNYRKKLKKPELYFVNRAVDDITDSISYSYDETDPRKTFLTELTGHTVDNIERILADKEKMKLNENLFCVLLANS